MPFSSTDIASLTGGFNQQVMLQQQQASMLTHQFGGYAPNPAVMPVASQGEQFAGLAMNQFANMGMSALGSQRLNQFGGGIAAPFAQTGQFLMGQMAYGAQQQQMLDVNLRQSYRFPNAFGGRGFSANETAMIGSGLRGMSHQRGPGGEVTSFEELGQLASNMGRMGMAEGVRSVKDFNEKFRTMLQSVKTIATELGTSLEEAQKVMASLKGSGIFRNQGQFAGLMRQGAIAGNVSTAEMSSSALMGAQISRSIGGLGRSGAYAGIHTMANIGAATQAGVLSEEDIYNVTGLAGAEGRQAMAQNMMSMDARFFSSALGRRALAGMAGKNGKLRAEDVQAFASGSVGTGETMNMAHRNLASVGRANFIRNEGRLRGEALQAFGGLGVASIAKGWLDQRGFDLNENDDRSMLFLQRKMGLGRDEADQAVKMARSLDMIKSRMQSSQEGDQYMQKQDAADRMSRPEEIVKRLEMARTQINDGLREVGANFYKSTSMAINEFLEKQVGGYARNKRAALAGVVGQLMRGGPGTDEVLRRELGLSYGADGRLQQAGLTGGVASLHSQLFGATSGVMTGAQANRLIAGNMTNFREAGYDLSGAQGTAGLRSVEDRAMKNAMAFAQGGGKYKSMFSGALGERMADKLASGAISGRGEDLLSSFAAAMPLAAGKDQATQSAMLRGALEGTGLGDAFGLDRMDAPTAIGGWGGRYSTLAAEQTAVGSMILGDRSRFGASGPVRLASEAGNLGTLASRMLGGDDTKGGRFLGRLTGKGSLLQRGLGAVDSFTGSLMADTADASARRGRIAGRVGSIASLGGLLGSGVSGWASKQARSVLGEYSDADKAALGEYMGGEEARGYLSSMDGSAEERQDAIDNLRKELVKAQRTKPTGADAMRVEGMRSMLAYGRMQQLGPTASREQKEKLSKDLGYKSVSEMETAANTGRAYLAENQRKDFAAVSKELRDQARSNIKSRGEQDRDYERRVKEGDIKFTTKEDKAAASAGESYIRAMNEIEDLQAGMGGTAETAQADAATLGDIQKKREALRSSRMSGSVAERRALARNLSQRGRAGEAAQLNAELNAEERLTRASKRGGDAGANILSEVAGSLGSGLNRKDFKDLGGAAGVSKLMEDLGLGTGSSVRNKDEIRQELMAISTGKTADGKSLSAAERGQRLASLQGRQELQEASKEKQEKKADANDPSYRRLGEIKDELGKLRQPLESSNTSLNQLVQHFANE